MCIDTNTALLIEQRAGRTPEGAFREGMCFLTSFCPSFLPLYAMATARISPFLYYALRELTVPQTFSAPQGPTFRPAHETSLNRRFQRFVLAHAMNNNQCSFMAFSEFSWSGEPYHRGCCHATTNLKRQTKRERNLQKKSFLGSYNSRLSLPLIRALNWRSDLVRRRAPE